MPQEHRGVVLRRLLYSAAHHQPLESIMGYNAYTLDTDFTIPADKIPAALHAVNVYLVGSEDDVNDGAIGANTLDEAFADNTCFENTGINEAGDWELSYHTGDKYYDDVVTGLLGALAPFAREGSFARFQGEDDSRWGFRVVNGELENEFVDLTWTLLPRKDGTAPDEPKIPTAAELFDQIVTGEYPAPITYSLAEVRDGTGWAKGVRFIAINAPA